MARRLLQDEQYAVGSSGGRTRTIIKANFVPLNPASRAGARWSARSRTRTVVKANFKRTRRITARASLKKSADYYAHRPDADGEKVKRLAFDVDHDELGREAVHAFVEEAEGEYAYRLVLSPGRDFSEEELIDWTRGVMRELEKDHDADWIGYVHASQTEHPHVHVIAFLDERLDREDFAHLRQQGDWEASYVMTMWHHLERWLEDEDDAESEGSSGSKAAVSSGSGGGGGGSSKIADILREGMQEQDEALQKRLELELD
ncbi:MAG: hypothetical protein HC933_14765 [Pleurocapsa sp. SU_196_0]|nr:hypothetical protein [Pleurocapsa sp. SU_196_0]